MKKSFLTVIAIIALAIVGIIIGFRFVAPAGYYGKGDDGDNS